jgi:hypothetical protein
MAKEKKHSGQDRGGSKGNKNIHKDIQPHYGYGQRNTNYNRPADKKPTMPEYTNKPRPSLTNIPPPPTSNPTNSKNPKIPKP